MTKPSHIIRIGDLSIWRDTCLRGTGFAASLLQGTAATASAPLIDAALAQEKQGGKPWPAARAAIEAAFAEDWTRAGAYLRDIVRSPRFREAVLWQNPGALNGAMEALLRRPAGAVDSKTREYERLVASYLQRYCAKNDTIGFFGPVGWATFDGDVAHSTVAPGSSLVDKRTIYFEHWAIDVLAAKLSADPALREGIAPRRMPTAWVEPGLLHHPVDRTSPLPQVTVELIEACDGVRSARAIAEQFVARGVDELASVEDVYAMFQELVDARVLIWRLEVPTQGFHPETALREAIGRVEPGAARDAASAVLDELEAARRAVAEATATPSTLDAAMKELDRTFVRLAESEANRGAGQTYAGRRIFYEDCRRDGRVVLGRSVLDKLAAPLALLQASARWFSYTLATRFRTLFEQHYRTLAAQVGSRDVDFIRFYTELQPHLSGHAATLSPTVTAVRNELQRTWEEILALPAGERRVQLRASDLAARVHAAFAAPHPGWPAARHQSPDLMLAASGPAALARGEVQVVLGEVHAGLNTVTLPTLAKEHPDPDRLHRARTADVGPSIAPVEPRTSVRRASWYSQSDADLDVELGDARSHRPRDHVFDVAGFVVTEREGRICVRRRDGSAEYDLIELLQSDLLAESYGFELLPHAAYRPRITIDDFVVGRERWRVDGATLAFAKAATPLDRFIGARKWAADLGVPRYAFIKAPDEPKPMYLDLASPVYVEILCKLARAGGMVTISEMLPSPDELWLVDADGATYCAELRTALVDDTRWQPAE